MKRKEDSCPMPVERDRRGTQKSGPQEKCSSSGKRKVWLKE